MDKEQELIKNLTNELLRLLEIKAKISMDKEEDGAWRISLETEESGLLIGYHGETLLAFQLIVGLMVYKKLDKWLRVIVDVGDYRAKREVSLRQMVLAAVERVRQTKESVMLPDLSSADRRLIHLAVKDHPEVFSESEGEGENRRLIIKPK